MIFSIAEHTYSMYIHVVYMCTCKWYIYMLYMYMPGVPVILCNCTCIHMCTCALFYIYIDLEGCSQPRELWFVDILTYTVHVVEYGFVFSALLVFPLTDV